MCVGSRPMIECRPSVARSLPKPLTAIRASDAVSCTTASSRGYTAPFLYTTEFLHVEVHSHNIIKIQIFFIADKCSSQQFFHFIRFITCIFHELSFSVHHTDLASGCSFTVIVYMWVTCASCAVECSVTKISHLTLFHFPLWIGGYGHDSFWCVNTITFDLKIIYLNFCSSIAD